MSTSHLKNAITALEGAKIKCHEPDPWFDTVSAEDAEAQSIEQYERAAQRLRAKLTELRDELANRQAEEAQQRLLKADKAADGKSKDSQAEVKKPSVVMDAAKRFAPGVWFDKDGNEFRINQMQTEHLRNVQSFMAKYTVPRGANAHALQNLVYAKRDEIRDELNGRAHPKQEMKQ